MSEHAAAPAPAPAAAPAAPQDPVRDLALQIYVQIAGNVFKGQQPMPDPKAVAMMSFKLAEAFIQAHQEINAAIIAEAKKRSSFSFDDFDLGAGAKKT